MIDVQITNLDPDHSIRVVYGDDAGELAETIIGPDDSEVISFEEHWKAELRVMGVDGDHAPDDAPDSFGKGA